MKYLTVACLKAAEGQSGIKQVVFRVRWRICFNGGNSYLIPCVSVFPQLISEGWWSLAWCEHAKAPPGKAFWSFRRKKAPGSNMAWSGCACPLWWFAINPLFCQLFQFLSLSFPSLWVGLKKMRKAILSPWWFTTCVPEADLTQAFCISSGIGARFGCVFKDMWLWLMPVLIDNVCFILIQNSIFCMGMKSMLC